MSAASCMTGAQRSVLVVLVRGAFSVLCVFQRKQHLGMKAFFYCSHGAYIECVGCCLANFDIVFDIMTAIVMSKIISR